jgi:hypothetical protein
MTENNGDDISRITERDVYYSNVRAFNFTRQLIVAAILGLFAVTVIGAGLAAYIGSSSKWGQLSPLVGTVLAIEAAALGSAIAFYMAKQD